MVSPAPITPSLFVSESSLSVLTTFAEGADPSGTLVTSLIVFPSVSIPLSDTSLTLFVVPSILPEKVTVFMTSPV